LSLLTLYHQSNMHTPDVVTSNEDDISHYLQADGIRMEHWPLKASEIGDRMAESDVLQHYALNIKQAKQDLAHTQVDIVNIQPGDSRAIGLRDKYLSEHTHEEDEARFLLSGSLLLYIHVNERIHVVQCVAGDYIVVPKGVKHWLDIGPEPDYQCIRIYNDIAALNNNYTGSYVAESTPRWEGILGLNPELSQV